LAVTAVYAGVAVALRRYRRLEVLKHVSLRRLP